MRTRTLFAVFLLGVCGLAVAQSEAERLSRQAELDARCESARQRAIASAKVKYIEECVAKGQRPDRAACERFYADYGERAGNRPPLFYDLAECVAASDFRNGSRSGK